MMQVTVQCFGPTRDFLGREVLDVEVDEYATVEDLLKTLAERSAGLADLLPSCAVAIGEDMVTRDQVLVEGDAVALLPPVNGGC